jgi:hypothetical protein
VLSSSAFYPPKALAELYNVDMKKSWLLLPDYRGLILVPNVDEIDEWGWEWDGSPAGLHPLRRSVRGSILGLRLNQQAD